MAQSHLVLKPSFKHFWAVLSHWKLVPQTEIHWHWVAQLIFHLRHSAILRGKEVVINSRTLIPIVVKELTLERVPCARLTLLNSIGLVILLTDRGYSGSSQNLLVLLQLVHETLVWITLNSLLLHQLIGLLKTVI